MDASDPKGATELPKDLTPDGVEAFQVLVVRLEHLAELQLHVLHKELIHGVEPVIIVVQRAALPIDLGPGFNIQKATRCLLET